MRARAIRRLAATCITAGLVACGLEITGTGVRERPEGGASTYVSGDEDQSVETSSDGGDVIDDGANDAGSDANDAGSDASDAGAKDASDASADAGCPTASATFRNGTLTVPRAARTLTIDGDLSDWSCATFFHVDKTNAGAILPTGVVIPNKYDFAVAWDSSYVYVAAHMIDPVPYEGNVTPEVFNNDAMEIFIGGDTTFDGSYSAIDHQFVIDWKNRTREYKPSVSKVPVAGFQSAVMKTPDGFVVEARIAANEIGHASLTAGTKFGFSIAGDESDGTNQFGWMVAYQPDSGCINTCCNAPCSTLFFGGLVLE
jgi:hypothetical protein